MRQNGDEGTGCEIKRRAVNVMYRHRHRSHSVTFIPPLQKSKRYVICPLLFFVTWCTAVHAMRKENHNKMTNEKEKDLHNL